MFFVFQMQNDETYLSYEDVCLRISDVVLLRGPYWLNDQVITFACEYFTQSFDQKRFAFVCPDTVQLIKFLDIDDIPGILGPLELTGKELVFFPLNDNRETEAGGAHWSLLTWHKTEGFRHFDSAGNSNLTVAKDVAGRLSSALGFDLTKIHKKPSCPQQNNGFDCGVFVIGFMRNLAKYYIDHGRLPVVVEAFDPTDLRLELLMIIDDLRKEQ